MSWQTPLRCSQASAAVVCTPVTPDMYSMRSPIAMQIARAASQGVSAVATSSPASSTTSRGGRVRGVWPSCSTNSVAASISSASVSQSSRTSGCGRGRTSTRLVAVSESSRCGVSTSNDETRVPQ